jgi:surfactin synthase thioesterase subunit
MTGKLIAIPYAGGSSFSYGAWRGHLPSTLSLVIPDYAGHGKRFHETLTHDFEDMVLDMHCQILKACDGAFVLYGHSLGALIAAYTAQCLYQQNRLIPKMLILGACRGPKVFRARTQTTPSDTQLFTYLMDVRNLPQEVLESSEFQSHVFPCIKNDFRIASQFNCPPLNLPPCPILCINGEQDYDVTDDAVNDWQNFSTQPIQKTRIPGGHFFLEDEVERTCQLIVDYLEPVFIEEEVL